MLIKMLMILILLALNTRYVFSVSEPCELVKRCAEVKQYFHESNRTLSGLFHGYENSRELLQNIRVAQKEVVVIRASEALEKLLQQNEHGDEADEVRGDKKNKCRAVLSDEGLGLCFAALGQCESSAIRAIAAVKHLREDRDSLTDT